VCDHIAVMRNGVVVEQGAAADVFGNPQHPYTRALLASVPGREWQHPASRGARSGEKVFDHRAPRSSPSSPGATWPFAI
jgi:ABC-type dipeptide/oligopeptide/nickel transport system ATPase component